MSGLNRSFNLLRGVMRPQIIPKANITAKPAKHVLSAAVSMSWLHLLRTLITLTSDEVEKLLKHLYI